MNIKLLLASLVLGSSSIAMASPAAPGVTVTTESYGAVDIRDHRGDAGESARAPIAQPVAQPVPSGIYRIGWHPGWDGGQPLPPVYRPVTLASGLHLPANSQTTINVGAQLGRFGTLQINATGGRTMVRQVYVQFADNQVQIVRNLDRTLAGNDSLTVDLDGDRRAIKRVIVYGAFGNQGRRTGGTFSVTAS
ncbi:MAG TPA: hypothetical protein VF469_26020 [Kofleriaceae bacterium]